MIAIPLKAGTISGWKSIAIEASAEPLVPLGPFSSEAGSLLTSSVYYGEHNNSPYTGGNRLEGSLLSVFVRKNVAQRLLKAQRFLPKEYRLLVFDAYRPLAVQSSLFYFYRTQLRLLHPNMDDAELDKQTQKYVSIPSADPVRPSPHNTGGSVDLAIVKLPLDQIAALDRIDNRLANAKLAVAARVTLETKKSAIVRKHAVMLNFGTSFDHGGEQAAIAYFEQRLADGIPLTPAEIEACHNRRLLYEVMTRAGMQAYEAEWWHFNAPESQMGAAAAGLTRAIYGAAIFNVQHVAHETFRRAIYEKTISTLSKIDDPRIITSGWPVEVIGPQNT